MASSSEDHSKLVAELKELIGTSEAMLRNCDRSRGASSLRAASTTPEGSSYSVNASVLSDHSYQSQSHNHSHNHSYSYYSSAPPAQSSFASFYSDTRDRSFDSSFTTPVHPLQARPASGNSHSDGAPAVPSTSGPPINPDLASHKPLLQHMLEGSFVRNAEYQRLEAAWQQQQRQRQRRLEAANGSLPSPTGRESAVRDSSAKVIRRIRAAQEQLWHLEDKSFQDTINNKFDEIFQPLAAHPRTQQSRCSSSSSSYLSPSSSPSNSNKRPRPQSSPQRNFARPQQPQHVPSVFAPSSASSVIGGSGIRRLHVSTATGSSSTSGSRRAPQSPPFNPISTPSSTPSHHYESMAFR